VSLIATASDLVAGPPEGRLLGGPGASMDEYRKAGGYRLLGAVAGGGPSAENAVDGLRAEVEHAGLRGRGGAWFPVALKWQAALGESGPRVVIANGAEDEPGSLKDRHLMAAQPHLVLDGALLTAAGVEADAVHVYVNEHAPLALEAMRSAVRDARAAGLIGSVKVDVVAAPGTYVAGEDSAAAEFIGGGEAKPRSKPPYPAVSGVRDRPTVVSNVETLAHLALVARDGAEAFKSVGTAEFPGTMLVTVPAECARPGVYEIEIGAYLDEVLAGLGGGFVDGPPRGVQVGGPAAGWLAGGDLHVRLTPTDVANRGSMLGCGAIRLLAAGHCAVDAVAATSEFFARSSCGKCPGCRMATQFVHRATSALLAGKGATVAHLDTAPQLVASVAGTSACSLVRFPVAPLASAREAFPEDFAAHLAGGECGLVHQRRTLRIEGT
jgi:NADH-quinone oxidoreductase subunit F